MKTDSLQQFVAARRQLEQERAELQSRVLEIERILGGAVPSVAARRGPGRPHSNGDGHARRGRGNNAISMREAAQQVLAKGPMDMQQLLEGIQRLGYKFTSKNPRNSLGVLLYTNKKVFRGKRGVFSLK